MEIVPTPEAAAPLPFHRRLWRLLYGQRWRVLFLGGSAVLGWFCSRLPEGPWRDACAWVATGADALAGAF